MGLCLADTCGTHTWIFGSTAQPYAERALLGTMLHSTTLCINYARTQQQRKHSRGICATGALNGTFLRRKKCRGFTPLALLGQTSKHRAAQVMGLKARRAFPSRACPRASDHVLFCGLLGQTSKHRAAQVRG